MRESETKTANEKNNEVCGSVFTSILTQVLYRKKKKRREKYANIIITF